MSETKPVVLVHTEDLFFAIRIQDVIEKLGGRVQNAGDPFDPEESLREAPVLVLVELGAGGQGNWRQVVQHVRKQTRGIPIVAFGSHVDVDAREAAREAGCDHVWSKSRFVDELPTLVERYTTPSVDTPGCADEPNDLVRLGVALFNQGRYYEAHDALEEAWFADKRPCRDLYQGLLQLGIALHHIEQDNYRGADKMLLRATSKFQKLPTQCQGMDVVRLLDHSRTLRQTLLSLGPDQLDQFPRQLFPLLASNDVAGLSR